MNITNDIIGAYIGDLYVNDNNKLMELRTFAEEKHVPIIQKDTEGLLRALLKLKKPAIVLEIGTAVGYSSCVFADCCGCRITTVEADENMANIAETNIAELGFGDEIKVLRGDARQVLEGLQGEKFDVAFIDAAKSHYREFWDLIIPLMNRDGLIICDNILMKGMTASDEFDTRGRYKTSIRKMREFVQYINNLDYADTTVLPVGDGVSVSVLDL